MSEEHAQRYDVSFQSGEPQPEPHFCREWDENGGCYGTNQDHGWTYEEACDQCAIWHESRAAYWRDPVNRVSPAANG